MKFYRNAIILVVVLALLIGGYFVISKKKVSDNTAATETTKSINVITLDTKKINNISIKNKSGLFDFTKDKTEWVLNTPTGIKTNSDQIFTLTDNITTLPADKIVEEKATSLNQYGLDNSALEIVAKTSDNKTQTLQLGNKTPTQDGYYLMDKDTNKVFTISTYYGDMFLDTDNQIRDKKLFDFELDKTSGAVTNATVVSMDRAGKLLFTAKVGADKNWVLTEPFEANTSGDSIEPLIDAVSKLVISKFIEPNATDLNKYGLQNPAYVLEVDTAKAKNRILIGAPIPDSSEVYAVLDGKKDVFGIDISTLTFLDKPFKEIIEPFVYITNIADVTKIDVTMDGRTDTSIVQTDKGDAKNKPDVDKDKFTFNGKLATAKDSNDRQPFRAYYQSLIGLVLDTIETGAVPTGTPEITFEYTLSKAPGKMKVEFISKDKDYYYVVKNGKYSNILVLKSQFDKPEGVRASYKALMDSLNKK